MKKSLYRLDQLNREELHKVNHIGCGYCIHEKKCPLHNPKINKARLGCLDYEPDENGFNNTDYRDGESKRSR